MQRFSGKLYDGLSSQTYDVEIEVDDNGLLYIIGYDVEPIHSRDISVSPRIGSSARYLNLPGEIVVESADNDQLDRLVKDWQSKKTSFVSSLESNTKIVVSALLAFVVFLFFLVTVGIPAASGFITASLPTSIDDLLGEEILDQLDGFVFFPSQIESAQQADLEELFTSLLPDTDRNFRLEFRASDLLGANAIALPNAQIVLTDDLISLADSANMIAAIMLHEIGHVTERHAMRGVISQAGLSMLLFGLTGDVASSAGILAVMLPEFLLQSGYSRELEWEADSYALEQMLVRGLDPNDFADMMERLVESNRQVPTQQEEVDEESDSFLDYFSSHPPSVERIARFRNAAGYTNRVR